MDVFLETERLMLRRFTPADVESLFLLHNDPEVMRFLDGGKGVSRREIEREYREYFTKDGYWAIMERATDDFVGWFGFHPGGIALPTSSSSATGSGDPTGDGATPPRAHGP